MPGVVRDQVDHFPEGECKQKEGEVALEKTW